MSSHSVVIAGAGIIGASLAYHLVREGASVTILEQHSPASGASSKSFGWINANYPKLPQFVALRQQGIEDYHRLESELGGIPGLSWPGSIWWEDEGEAFDRHVTELDNYGYPATVLDTSELEKLEPRLQQVPARAARFAAEAIADPASLTRQLLDAACNLGARLVTGSAVQGLIHEEGRCTGVTTRSGKLQADTVVIAAGTSSGELMETAGLNLPMSNQHGIIVRTFALEPVFNHILLAPSLHFYQRSDGCIVAADDYGGGSGEGDPLSYAEGVLEKLHRYTPAEISARIQEITVGLRPIPGDGLPVIGKPQGQEGLYIASMHSGVTLAAVVGRLAAAEICHNDLSGMLSAFRLERFNNA